jgi:hypothetical protein
MSYTFVAFVRGEDNNNVIFNDTGDEVFCKLQGNFNYYILL